MNNPVAKAFLEFRSLFFKNQPYEISPLGRIEDIQSISIEAMRSYYSSWYSPGTAIIIIVGDFDSAGLVAELVEKYFGAITSTNEKSVHHFFNGPTAGSHWMKRKVDFDVPILLIGYPAPASSSDDVLPLEIIQTILSQGETSRIHKELVRKKSVAVMAGGINHFLKHAGMSLFFAAFTPDTRCKNVESALNKQIELIKTHGISESEMQKVKNISLTSRTFELFSAESICHHLGYAETVDGSFTAWVRRLETLEKLHRDQIIEAAIKYWKDDMRHTLYLQPKKINPLLFLMGLVRRVIPG
jgi:zinc protease